MGTPTRFTYGATTVSKGMPLGSYPMQDPFHSSSDAGYGVSEYQNDFNTLGSTEYTVTGSGSAIALASGAGGVAVLTPGGTTTASSAYKTGQMFQFISGQKAWFSARFKVSAVSGNKSFYVGLQAGSATTDGIWFSKAAASTSVNLVSVVGSTSTTLVTGVATAAADTYLDLALHFDGTDLLVFVAGNLVSRVSGPTIGASATTLTNAVLTPVFQITPTATDTLTVDYVLAAEEISR